MIKKLFSKIRASLYVFRKAEIMRNMVIKEISGEYDNLCPECSFNEHRMNRDQILEMLDDKEVLRISIYLGGALGDYIVYLRFVDEISTICACRVDLYLDKVEFAQFVFGDRPNVRIICDAENCLFTGSAGRYDLAVHLDHGVTLRCCNLNGIQRKAPAFYATACRIVEYTKNHRLNIDNQHERECVLLRRARITGETKWSKLSCGGAVDMRDCYSSIGLLPEDYAVLIRYGLPDRRYITVNFGADKQMGGTAQTKLLPAQTLEAFIAVFHSRHPDWLVVQTGVRGSRRLAGADLYAFDCRLGETAVVLKYSACHVDCEGGLVHLASQLSTPCVVSFGPTPVYYYGYDRNENIVSPACGDCMSVTGNWSRVCAKGMREPECMKAITEGMISDRVEKRIDCGERSDATEETDRVTALKARPNERFCLIGPLTSDAYETAMRLRREGGDVCVCVPVKLDDETLERRRKLRRAGVRVEYGSPIQVARPSRSFDVVFCDAGGDYAQMRSFVLRECARLLTGNGKIIWKEQEAASA